ncbi:hypothetical protein [Metaclostridioides mangenotii]|uniref:hypothetical protein n=1 Tax=Metaclostridioides mangenotii TaxID=1540 RepID=UPI0004643463|nr:hypothetical protein [Clostridioides mangenotii]
MKVLAVDIALGSGTKNQDIITLIGADGLYIKELIQLDVDMSYEIWAEELKKFIDLVKYDKIIISKVGIGISLATELEKILDKNELIVVGYEPPLDRHKSILNLRDSGILEQLDINLKLAPPRKLSNGRTCVELDDEYYYNKRKSVGIIRSLKLINDFYVQNNY